MCIGELQLQAKNILRNQECKLSTPQTNDTKK